MPITNKENPSSDSAGEEIEQILQRLFCEKEVTAHRTAIWDLFARSGDWELYEKLEDIGGQQSLETYFRSLLDNFEEAITDCDLEGDEQKEQIRELYAAPIVNLHNGDWAGTAAALHEILLGEVYGIYAIDEKELPFEEATALGLQRWVGEEVLFPLSVIEYMAFSDYLTTGLEPGLLDSNFALLMTLFFSAQAYLDLRERSGDPDLEIFPGEDA